MRSPQVRAALLHCTTAGYTPPRFDHKSFLVLRPVALLGSASYPILVHRLTVYVPRFLPTLGHPHAVALRFARRDQLATGLAPVGVRPCWAHAIKIPAPRGGVFRTARAAALNVIVDIRCLDSSRTCQSCLHLRASPLCSQNTRQSKTPLPTTFSSLVGNA